MSDVEDVLSTDSVDDDADVEESDDREDPDWQDQVLGHLTSIPAAQGNVLQKLQLAIRGVESVHIKDENDRPIMVDGRLKTYSLWKHQIEAITFMLRA